MNTTLLSAACRRSGGPARSAVRGLAHGLTVLVVAACSDSGIVEPPHGATPFAGSAGGRAAVVVTPNYSAYDTRSEFSAAGVIAQSSDFDDGEFMGKLVYLQPTPWTFNGVTYTSAPNIIFSAAAVGVQSNALSTEFGAAITGQLAASDAFTMLGVDVTLIGDKVPVSFVVTTNLRAYAFAGLDVPVAPGRRFLGLSLSQPGEYVTGFEFAISSAVTGLLLDDVAVGHVGNSDDPENPNADPEASVGGPYSSPEGTSVALVMSGTDGDGDVLTYAWDLGDGTTGTGPTPPASHVYADNGTYQILLAVDDGRGGVDTARTTAIVANVAPSLAPFSVLPTPIALTATGATLAVRASFSDPGTSDTHVVELDCGAGAQSQAAASQNDEVSESQDDEVSDGMAGLANGTCSFSSAGVYTVRLTVRDDDGDSDTEVATEQVVVYDAAGGRIMGGGWIGSPAGAYALAASVSGKLTFGFVAGYQSSSASIPSGNAEFRLQLGNLDFRSNTFDWLVVSGSSAHLQGSGTMSGTGDYGFSVVATDGAPADGIRIRIWNRLTGLVVYDNSPGVSNLDDVTPLGGGSIQVFPRP